MTRKLGRWKEIDRRVEGIKVGKGAAGFYCHVVYKVTYLRNGGARARDFKDEIEYSPTLYSKDTAARYLGLALRVIYEPYMELLEHLEYERELRKNKKRKTNGKRNQGKR